MFNLTRKILRFLPTTLAVISFLPTQAGASGREVITQPTDFFFSYLEPTQFLAQTYQSDILPSDPQLWLYNADTGQEIASNDDYLGLQSKIDLQLPAGNYRLRAATCCGDPNAWRDGIQWNIRYELSFNGLQSNTTTTSEVTTTTEEPTTTTTEPETTTTEPEPTTTTEPEVVTTTTEIPETTTTEVPTTTTEAPYIEPETTVELPETTFTVITEPEEVLVPEEEITTPETTIEIPVDEPVDIPVDTIVDEPTDNQDLVNDITDENLTAEEIASVVDEALGNAESEEELLSIASDLLDSELSQEQFDAVIESIFDQPEKVLE